MDNLEIQTIPRCFICGKSNLLIDQTIADLFFVFYFYTCDILYPIIINYVYIKKKKKNVEHHERLLMKLSTFG